MFDLKKVPYLFWGALFLMILLQLSYNKLSFWGALIYSITFTLTLRVHVLYVVSRLLKQHLGVTKTARFVFFILLTSLITASFLTLQGYVIMRFFLTEKDMLANDMMSLFFGGLLISIMIPGVYYSIELFKRNVETEKRHQELKNSVLEMEMANLRTQLSPHFTFNIFNNLQFLIRKDKDEALELLARYSKILRYYVYEAQNKWIKLEDEIDFLKHYVQLEKDRSGEDLQISCHWDVIRNQFVITPFLLSTFVENSFKHVSAFTDKVNYINLHIFLQNENELVLTIENSTDSALNQSKSDGFGLTYVQKRLELSYQNRYRLEQSAQDNKYSVHLQLKLTEA